MFDDERRLIERARQGETTALAELYDRHYEPVYRYCYYRVGDTALAEDLTSQVFVRMVENLDSFGVHDKPLLAWLYVIARNLIVDAFRQNQVADPVELDDELVAEDTLSHQVERRLAANDLVAAFAGLTEEQRQVILLKFVQDYDNAEIARIMDKSEGSVKSLQHRALAALRRILKDET